MRAVVACVGLLALLCGCGDPPPQRAAATPAFPPCRHGDLARTAAGPTVFTDGWVQLKLVHCPDAPRSPGAAVEVESATADLAFKAGRPGASTLGVIEAAPATTRAAAAFEVGAPLTASTDRLVLAPWTGGGAPPRIGAVRVVASPRMLPTE